MNRREVVDACTCDPSRNAVVERGAERDADHMPSEWTIHLCVF